MKFLLDLTSHKVEAKMLQYPGYVGGQLMTPLSKRLLWSGPWAVDNGAFSRFDRRGFERILAVNKNRRDSCLFVAAPDIVGSARRTLEVFEHWSPLLLGWPIALVLQDGSEDHPIPWSDIAAVFVGGTDKFKESQASIDCVKAALAIGKHVHVGRVNTVARYRLFAELGAHTADGTGICKDDKKLERIAAGATDGNLPLFGEGDCEDGAGGDGI